MPSEKAKGIAGTVVIHLILLLILVFYAFTIPAPPEVEEGIMVNFGTDQTGFGMIEPSPPAVQEETAPPPATVPDVKQQVKEEALLTQNNEEAPEVKKVDPEAEKKKLEKIEADRIRKEQLEAERKKREQEELERQRIAAEQQRQTDIMNRTKNALAGSRNSGTNSTSEGIAGGTGNQGVLTGSLDSKVYGDGGGTGNKGISYSLGGRGVQKLTEPKYDYQQEGRVVVEVSVDPQGKVVQAVPGIKGSTILDDYLLRVAKEAALASQFESKADAPAIQKGTITYNFKLK